MTQEASQLTMVGTQIFYKGLSINCPKCKDAKKFLSQAGYIESCKEC